MKNTLLFAAFILLFHLALKAQEFRGIDFRIDIGTNDTFDYHRHLSIGLYYESQDTISMDSLRIAHLIWRDIPKTEHLFLDDNIQLLRFEKDIILNLGFNDFWTDTMYVEGINNYNNGELTPINFSTEFFYSTLAEDPIFNSLQTEAYFEDGVFYFDAGGVDPNGHNLGYYLDTVFGAGTNLYELYSIPVGTDTINLDPETGALIWDRPSIPGKYLIVLGYSQSFSPLPPAWNVGLMRYLVIEVKEADIVSSNEENTTNNGIKTYPNPAKSEINVHAELQENIGKECSISVSNLMGQSLHNESFIPTSSKINKEINIIEWTPGIYILTLRTGDEIRTEKIVVY